MPKYSRGLYCVWGYNPMRRFSPAISRNDVKAGLNAGLWGIWKEDVFFDPPEYSFRLIRELAEFKEMFDDASGGVPSSK